MSQMFNCHKEVAAVTKAVNESKSEETETLESTIIKELNKASEAQMVDIHMFLETLLNYAKNLDGFLTNVRTFKTPSKTLKLIIKNLTTVRDLALSSAQSTYDYDYYSGALRDIFQEERRGPWAILLQVLKTSSDRCTPTLKLPVYKFTKPKIPVAPPIEEGLPRPISPSPFFIPTKTIEKKGPEVRNFPKPKVLQLMQQIRNPSPRSSSPRESFTKVETGTMKPEGEGFLKPTERKKVPVMQGLRTRLRTETIPCPPLDAKVLDRISPILRGLPWNSEQFLSIARILRYLKDKNGQPYLSPRFTPSQSRFAQKTIVPETRGHYGVRGKLILPSHLYEILRSSCANVNSFVHALEEIRDRDFRIQHLEDHWNPPKHNEEWKTQKTILNKNFTSSNETKCLQTKGGDIQDLIHLIRIGNLNGSDLHSLIQLLSLETKMRPLPRNIFRVGLLSGDIRPQVDKYRGANNMNPAERKPSLLAELLEQNCTNIPLLNHFIYTNLLTPVQQSQFQTLRGNLK
jgi:hypothetical protein